MGAEWVQVAALTGNGQGKWRGEWRDSKQEGVSLPLLRYDLGAHMQAPIVLRSINHFFFFHVMDVKTNT